LNLFLQQPYLTILPGKLTFYGKVLKSVASVLVRKAADKTRNTLVFKFFGVRKINEPVVTSNKLTNNLAGLVISGLGPARWAPEPARSESFTD
jgi:hypothetical protein